MSRLSFLSILSRCSRLVVVPSITVALAAIVPVFSQSVFAATLDVTSGVLTYTAASGEVNNLTVSTAGTSYGVNDAYNIVLTPNASAVGFRGGGTKTVT